VGTGYTVGGDTWASLTWPLWEAQSFATEEDLDTFYVMLLLKNISNKTAYYVSLWLMGAHAPTGPQLAGATIISTDFPPGVSEAVCTAKLTPYIHITPITTFCIVVYATGNPADSPAWQYDNWGANYIPGHRLHSVDGGQNWIEDFDQDHMFYVWGYPPAIPPPPGPAQRRWVILDIQQIPVEGGIKIIITTDAPCHLTLCWTLKEPWKHRATTTVRGLAVLWDAYWCYVAWTTQIQEEEGDTEIHTFTVLGWPVCQTRYVRFTGTIGGVDVPSDSPIFIKHNVGMPTPAYIYYEPWTWEFVNPPAFVLKYTEHWSS
jgi:hypothetical protein